jgi:hypothetical protein
VNIHRGCSFKKYIFLDKPPNRYAIGRWPNMDGPPGMWRDRKHDERYYSRESQESPWEDDYSNEAEEIPSPHYLTAKRNWKRPSSASEMDRKTGEIKSRHYLPTGTGRFCTFWKFTVIFKGGATAKEIEDTNRDGGPEVGTLNTRSSRIATKPTRARHYEVFTGASSIQNSSRMTLPTHRRKNRWITLSWTIAIRKVRLLPQEKRPKTVQRVK